MGRLRQGGGIFVCQILVCMRVLPTSQGSLCTRYPLSLSLAPSPSAYPTPQCSGELGAKSPIYLSQSPSSHLRQPQLPSQLLIDCLSGCLLFWWVTGACVTCGKWPDEGGVGEAKPQKTLERG